MSRTRVSLLILLTAGTGLFAGCLPSANTQVPRAWPELVVKGGSNAVFQLAVSTGNRTLFSTYSLAPDGAPGDLPHGVNTFDGGSLTVEKGAKSFRFQPSAEIGGVQVRNLSTASVVLVSARMSGVSKGEVSLVSSNQYVSMHLNEGRLLAVSDSTNFVLEGAVPAYSGGLSSASIELFR